MTHKFLLPILLVCCMSISCSEEIIIKPKAALLLEYPEPHYQYVKSNCHYAFDLNHIALLQKRDGCNVNLEYPAMRATIHLTYNAINNNLDTLLYEAQKLTYSHTTRASKIDDFAYEDTLKNVYGQYFELGGNAATLSQFYVTDTVNHFINGSLYFRSRPNFDSLYPAAVYLRQDIRRLMESLEWD